MYNQGVGWKTEPTKKGGSGRGRRLPGVAEAQRPFRVPGVFFAFAAVVFA